MVGMTAYGPSRTCSNVGFCAAVGGQADVRATIVKRRE